MINNINLVQCATSTFNNINFNAPLKIFLRRLFSSKRQALPNEKTIEEKSVIRVGRKYELPNDHIIRNHFHDGYIRSFTFHQTFWKKNVQFSMHNSNSTSKNSDSCILFNNDQRELDCGFIVGIISDSKQQCNLIVHKVHIERQDTFTFKKKRVINPYIFWGKLTVPPTLMTIQIQDIVVKIAYSNAGTMFHFFQYPNTTEST